MRSAVAAGGGNGTNPSKPIFDSDIRTFVPKTSAKQASPPPAAKQKTDQSAGSETLDDVLRFTEQPLFGVHDLQPTLHRIASGTKFPHKNDGSTFKNYPPKGQVIPLLPIKPKGYYK